MVTQASIVDRSWQVILERAAADGDLSYAHFVCGWPLSYYRSRLKQIGMTGFRRVLDVGCGFGQWTAALALENVSVVGIDVHSKRLETARAMLSSLCLENADFRLGSAAKLPFEIESFDAVFCYGVMMFADRATVVEEFNRVLKPGGRVYVCTNARGWWLRLVMVNAFRNVTLAKTAWSAFRHGRSRGTPNATDIADVDRLMNVTNWDSVQAAGEGRLGKKGAGPKPVYSSRYLGFDCVIEFLASKRGAKPIVSAVCADVVASRIKTLVENVAAQTTYCIRGRLAKSYMPRAVVDLVNNTNLPAVQLASEAAVRTDRNATLRQIFSLLTKNSNDDESKVMACITFAQLRFYHHFAGQPMLAPDRMVLDPITSLLFGACRCGNVARFLVDLFEVNGYSSRLLGGACHTAAEVEIGGRWVIADASLYPPGIAPRSISGRLLTLEEAVDDPELFDVRPSYINYEDEHIALFRNFYPEAYVPITKWLEGPLFPSVAYFGKDFADNRKPGFVQRWRKAGDPTKWEANPDYGWYSLIEEPGIQGEPIPTIQRPPQVKAARREGNDLVWDFPNFSPGSLRFSVVLRKQTRGWSYLEVPVGFEFKTPGLTVTSETTRANIPSEFDGVRMYATITAAASDTPDRFFLPSREFIV